MSATHSQVSDIDVTMFENDYQRMNRQMAFSSSFLLDLGDTDDTDDVWIRMLVPDEQSGWTASRSLFIEEDDKSYDPPILVIEDDDEEEVSDIVFQNMDQLFDQYNDVIGEEEIINHKSPADEVHEDHHEEDTLFITTADFSSRYIGNPCSPCSKKRRRHETETTDTCVKRPLFMNGL